MKAHVTLTILVYNFSKFLKRNSGNAYAFLVSGNGNYFNKSDFLRIFFFQSILHTLFSEKKHEFPVISHDFPKEIFILRYLEKKTDKSQGSLKISPVLRLY